MASTLWTILIVVISSLVLTFNAVNSIKCRKCYPPMPEEDCKRSDAIIDCHEFEPLGYDSCIQVEYNGNYTVARTCYRSFMCPGAKEWCKLRGPCTVKCCSGDLCNSSDNTQSSTVLMMLLMVIGLGVVMVF